MNLHFAPLEGITTFTYRNLHNELFGGVDTYFAPFITPSDNERVSIKSLRDILPERNENINLIPQVLTANSEAFLRFEEKIKTLGYSEVNINVGCPSSTVVKKGRGAGFLKNPDEMERFFEEIFKKTEIKISVKTRVGFYSGEEMERLADVYRNFPFSSVIIHPRVREDYYRGEPKIEIFKKAYASIGENVCYNGDVFKKADFDKLKVDFPDLKNVMIGRGAIKNPAIFREIRGGEKLKTEELINFTKRLKGEYLTLLGSEVYTIHKLKEIWIYMMENYPEEKKILKAVKKANKPSDLTIAIENLPEIK